MKTLIDLPTIPFLVWILKNSKELLEHLKSPTFKHVTSIKFFDFKFIQPYLIWNWKTDSLVLSETPSCSKSVTVDTVILYKDTKKHILWRSTLILNTSTLKMTHQDAWISNWQYFRGFCQKSLPADNRNSIGYKLRPSSRRHFSVFTRNGIHTVFALNWKKQLASRFDLT